MDAYQGSPQRPAADAPEMARSALSRFLRALEDHDVSGVETLLTEDVHALTDGGGEFRSALRPIVGRDKVARFFIAVTQVGPDIRVRMAVLNGTPAVIVDVPAPGDRLAPRIALTLDVDADGKICRIYAVSATAKLTAIR